MPTDLFTGETVTYSDKPRDLLAEKMVVENSSDGTIKSWKPTLWHRVRIGARNAQRKLEDIVYTSVTEAEKGARETLATLPQAAGALTQEAGERAEEKPSLTDWINPATGGAAGAVGKWIRSKQAERSNWDEKLAQHGIQMIENNKKFIKEKYPELQEIPDTELGKWFRDIGSGGATLLTALGLTALTKSPNAAAVSFGLYQKGQIYKEAREKGFNSNKAGKLSSIAGLVEGGLEYVGLDYFFSRFGGGAIRNALIRGGIEGLQEWSQTTGENLITRLGGIRELNKFGDFFEGSGRAAIIGFLLGTPSGAVLSMAEKSGAMKQVEEKVGKEEARKITYKTIEHFRENIAAPVTSLMAEQLAQEQAEQETLKEQPTTQPLIQEAKKYKSAEEFVNFMRGSATQYRPYNPKLRATIGLGEDSARISDLGIDPELEVTIYRGVSDGNKKLKNGKIVDGDFVTTDFESAASYAGAENVISKKVKAKDLIADYASEFDKENAFAVGAEYVYSDSKNKLINYTDTQLTNIWKQAQGEQEKITQEDLPPESPEFPGVKEDFLKQPKKKTSIVQYFKPAEYHLKELGFDAEIGQPIREALQDFSIELMEKNELIREAQQEHFANITKKERKASNEKIWQYMDKGIPKNAKNIEAEIARKYRKETQEMLERLNEVREELGQDKIKGIKNYILHSLRPEILNEVYQKGVIPSELAKVMEYIPPKNVFLRTAQQRTGVPEEWLIKDPHQLMKTMYAIDLRYINLQKALNKVNPYIKAVKNYSKEIIVDGRKTGVDEWSPETYKYIDDWIKQAIKMRPSNWDVLVNNLMEHTIAPVMRKGGIKVSNMPYRDMVNFLSASVHTGALGMRVKPVLRNLVQSTFDWVMYGTKYYMKGTGAFNSLILGRKSEAMKILNKSKVWRTRVPYEAQELSTLKKVFKIGGLGYRLSDLHNVGKGLLTRYYYAKERLNMNDTEAIKWADNDLPATQWSYRREDLPRAYWTTTGRAFWTLGSWWMNYYNRFLPEVCRRTFHGVDVDGRKVSSNERLAGMRLLMLIGILFGVREASEEMLGMTIDYVGQIKPSFLREAPIIKTLYTLRDVGRGIVDENERVLKKALRELEYTTKIFIPWYLASEELFKLIKGEKSIEDYLFYGNSGNKKKGKKFIK